ncbi:MAG TPA: hypothetical protein VIP09_02080 [Dehalococcoidia bacterium]
MSKRALTHPRFLAKLPDIYPFKAAIQQATASGTSFGTLVETWATVSGLGLIDCRVAPVLAQEMRGPQFTQLVTTHQIALRGYYPQIVETMRAVVDDVGWDIQGVEYDGNKITTRLHVLAVTLA